MMRERERKIILNLADTIQGEINRMCVTKDLTEFDTMYSHAGANLFKLAKLIYLYNFKASDQNKM